MSCRCSYPIKTFFLQVYLYLIYHIIILYSFSYGRRFQTCELPASFLLQSRNIPPILKLRQCLLTCSIKRTALCILHFHDASNLFRMNLIVMSVYPIPDSALDFLDKSIADVLSI